MPPPDQEHDYESIDDMLEDLSATRWRSPRTAPADVPGVTVEVAPRAPAAGGGTTRRVRAWTDGHAHTSTTTDLPARTTRQAWRGACDHVVAEVTAAWRAGMPTQIRVLMDSRDEVLRAEQELKMALDARDAQILEALAGGARTADIAAYSGLSRQRIYQLREQLVNPVDGRTASSRKGGKAHLRGVAASA